MEARYKPSAKTYYPVMLLPHNYTVQNSSHPDYKIQDHPESSEDTCARYTANLQRVVAASNQTQYERLRRDTGLAKPSLLSGLICPIPIPQCFPIDNMHLLSLNIPELIMSLFRATISCDATDDEATWPWAVLADKETWDAHGALVQSATQYLPTIFGRAPRNIADKINSGYKAWEWLLYFYGLLPGYLRPLLPEQYYTHFCKLVAGMECYA